MNQFVIGSFEGLVLLLIEINLLIGTPPDESGAELFLFSQPFYLAENFCSFLVLVI